jgi:hypothetical protein
VPNPMMPRCDARRAPPVIRGLGKDRTPTGGVACRSVRQTGRFVLAVAWQDHDARRGHSALQGCRTPVTAQC